MRDWELIEDAARPHVEAMKQKINEAETIREALTVTTDSADAEEAGLTLLATLNATQKANAKAMEAVTQELLMQRVPQTRIADAAGVTRQTVVRWKQAMREDRAAEREDTNPLFDE